METSKLKDFRFELRHCLKLFDISDKQIAVAQNIRRSFGIPEKNILKLIAFANYVLKNGEKNNSGFNYRFIREVSDFIPAAGEIKSVTFAGEAKSLTITNSELTLKLMRSLLDVIDSNAADRSQLPADAQAGDNSLKLLARELYDDLVQNEKLTPWRALSVVGYIFLLYDLKLWKEEPLLSEHEFQNKVSSRGDVPRTYLNYLTDRIKTFID